MAEKNFGHLGFSFQQSLIKSIIEDKKYGETIIDVLESKFFENVSFRFIMEHMKEFYKNYKCLRILEENENFVIGIPNKYEREKKIKIW